jgi:hypothetical protein
MSVSVVPGRRLTATYTGEGAVLAARGGRVKTEYASLAGLAAALLNGHCKHLLPCEPVILVWNRRMS